MNVVTHLAKRNATIFARRVADALVAGPATRAELCALTGYDDSTALRGIQDARRSGVLIEAVGVVGMPTTYRLGGTNGLPA